MWIDPRDHKIVGEFLASIRQEAGVNQVELARRLGKPQSFVSSYERGQRRVDFVEFALIMKALGRDPGEVAAELIARVIPLVRQSDRRT